MDCGLHDATEIFNLIPSDVGRSLCDITHRLKDEDLIADVETVLDNLQPIEREIRAAGGSVYLMQITPYRTSEDRISGTIVVFVNITPRKKAEENLRESEKRFGLIIKGVEDYAIITTDARRNANARQAH